MLRCEWTVPAARELEHAQEHEHALDPVRAEALAQRVLAATHLLAGQPDRGHPGHQPDTREWRIAQTPYRLVYRVCGDALQLLHLHVDAQDRVAPSRLFIERLEPWLAALLSVAVHVVMALLLLYASPPTVSTPQGTAGGSRMRVEVLGDTTQPVQAAASNPKATPASTPVRSTLVKEAKNPLPPDTTHKPNHVHTRRPPKPVQHAPQPPTPTPTEQRAATWSGRPPGMLDQDVAPHDEGMGDNDDLDTGYRNDLQPGQASMEVGGFQVIYELSSETQLRAWKAQGMTEISIILPGTHYRMVCALEIALRRGSGKCRMLPPDSPELQHIGDAREVINMMQVYRNGEPVWRGPGPYR